MCIRRRSRCLGPYSDHSSEVLDFKCQLDWPWGAQTKHSFWICLWVCFLLASAFRWVEADHPPHGSGLLQSVWGLQRAKHWKRGFLPCLPACLAELGQDLCLLGIGLGLAPLALKPSVSDWIMPPSFLRLHLVENGLLDDSTSITLWVSSTQ